MTCKAVRSLLVGLILLHFSWFTLAKSLVLPPADVDLVGQVDVTRAQGTDTLLDIARRYDLGQDEIIHANPDVDRWLPGEGAEVILPSRYILPKSTRKGIVLNVPEMRLYYFPKPGKGQKRLLITHPVSIGRMDWNTPLGLTRVVSKSKDPTWRPPKSLKEEAAADGEPLPDLVPPGPDNPLGRFALRLGLPGYLIHSTNKPYGVGMRVTHGCVRMYPEDIGPLFDKVSIDTTVAIVNQPIKLGWLADTLFMEVHSALEEERVDDQTFLRRALDLVHAEIREHPIILDGRAVHQAVAEQRGIPIPISKGRRKVRIGEDASVSSSRPADRGGEQKSIVRQ